MIVEFLEEREFLTAWVLTAATHRLELLAANGRTMTVSQNRILNRQEVSDPGDKQGRLALIRQTDQERKTLAAQLDIEELWAILEDEEAEFSFEFLAELYFGRKGSVLETSALMRAIFTDNLRFRFNPNGTRRHTAEEVEELRLKRAKAQDKERIQALLIQWLTLAKKGQVAPEPDESAIAYEQLLDLTLWGEGAKNKAAAKHLLRSAAYPPDAKGAFEALVDLGRLSRHENLDLLRLEVPTTFSPELLAELKTLPSIYNGLKSDRLDLTSLTTLTIDSNGARDLDDAVSIKSLAGGRWQVGIHITDVASLITAGSPLDLEAQRRASSIYLPDAKYPMFPTELSEDLLSLTLGDIKPTLSILATVEQDGSISDYEVARALIRVDRQMSFFEADQLLDDDSDLVDLWDLAQTLLAWRESHGGVTLNIPKLNVYFLPDGTLGAGVTQWDTPAKTIVGELMILANCLAADYLTRRQAPCPYRFQEKAQEPKPYEQKILSSALRPNPDMELALNLAARRRTGRSGLTFDPAPHHGLGLASYTSFTAPMRRYLDLLVARQIHSILDNDQPLMDRNALLLLAEPTYARAQQIQKMQSARQRYWLKAILADKVGQEFTAIVFEQRGARIRFCITDYMLENEFTLPQRDNPPQFFGQLIKVKLASIPDGDEPLRFIPRL